MRCEMKLYIYDKAMNILQRLNMFLFLYRRYLPFTFYKIYVYP